MHRDHGHGSGMRAHYTLDTNVIAIDVFPGITETALRHMLATPGIKGIVLRTYGTGNAPTAAWFTEAIAEAVRRGIVIANVTQCADGGVHPGRYLAGDILSNTGVISGADITFEAALTKMMFLFGLGLSPEAVRRRMVHTIAGEMSV